MLYAKSNFISSCFQPEAVGVSLQVYRKCLLDHFSSQIMDCGGGSPELYKYSKEYPFAAVFLVVYHIKSVVYLYHEFSTKDCESGSSPSRACMA